MKTTILLLLLTTCICTCLKAQSHKQDTTKQHQYILTEGQTDSLINSLQASQPILFKPGSGISLDLANYIQKIDNSIVGSLMGQYFKFYPAEKRKADSLSKIKPHKP